MDFSADADDHELRQSRLAKFGRVIALVTLGFVGLNLAVSVWLGTLSFNRGSLPLLLAIVNFAALWLLLRRGERSRRFVGIVELGALSVGAAAFSSIALVLDLTSSPDMIARTMLTFMLLVYAVYVPSTARRTLLVALLMTVPLLTCVFLAFSKWDPALHSPRAARWPEQDVGDMAYPATLVSAAIWTIVVGIAAGFSQTVHGLRKAVSDIKKLGQYTLEKKLGEGGMGVVYRASHAMLRRPTAVKLLLPDRTGKEALARFEREVRRTAMLTHPNTVTVYDYGRTTEGVFYYAMELLEGLTLEQIVELDGPQPGERVIHLLDQAAASLAEAHDAGLIHRDVKPSNILLVDRGGIADLVKVVDFGLVKDVRADERSQDTAQLELTQEKAITGTPLYMAPESLTSPESVDGRADLYALGAVGYWLLTGTHVFSGKTVLEVCAQHLHAPPVAPSARLGGAVAADLESLVLSCLAKRPDDRPANAHAFRESLRACAGAGLWSNARASAWWAAHRGVLPPAGASPSTPAAERAPLTVTRLAEHSPLGD
jgi:serine/threonine-protein kinase